MHDAYPVLGAVLKSDEFKLDERMTAEHWTISMADFNSDFWLSQNTKHVWNNFKIYHTKNALS
jgi:hypothetical protein